MSQKKDEIKIPIWAQLRIVHGFASDEERKKLEDLAQDACDTFSKIRDSNINETKKPGPEESFSTYGCEDSCVSVCEKSCMQTCEESCESACLETCQNTCEKICQSGCEQSCLTGCETSCEISIEEFRQIRTARISERTFR